MSWRSWAVLLLLLGLTAGSFVLLEFLARRAHERGRGPPPEIDYVLDRVALTRLDADGRLTLRLSAPEVHHRRVTRSIHVRAPRIEGFGLAEGDARLQAAWGEVDDAGTAIELREQVQIEQRGPTQQPTRLDTERLIVIPDQRRATSDTEVVVHQGASILRGRGLEIDFAAQAFVLHADIEARWVAPPRSGRTNARAERLGPGRAAGSPGGD
jgi:lipopolysaccharide export system protein LptC